MQMQFWKCGFPGTEGGNAAAALLYGERILPENWR